MFLNFLQILIDWLWLDLYNIITCNKNNFNFTLKIKFY